MAACFTCNMCSPGVRWVLCRIAGCSMYCRLVGAQPINYLNFPYLRQQQQEKPIVFHPETKGSWVQMGILFRCFGPLGWYVFGQTSWGWIGSHRNYDKLFPKPDPLAFLLRTGRAKGSIRPSRERGCVNFNGERQFSTRICEKSRSCERSKGGWGGEPGQL